jgi:uncharacterized surface protein with fasciclin (FAS1) repeats
MAETKKVVNYTPEMVERLHEVYQPEATESERDAQIVELAEELGKNTKSIRAKLVREGLYVKKEYKAKTGEKPATKETIVSDIARVLGVDADAQLSGLEKATKNCLLFLHKTVTVFADTVEAEEGETEETAS